MKILFTSLIFVLFCAGCVAPNYGGVPTSRNRPCVGSIGPGGPCSIGPGGGQSIGPGGGYSIGPGGGQSIGPGGGRSLTPNPWRQIP